MGSLTQIINIEIGTLGSSNHIGAEEICTTILKEWPKSEFKYTTRVKSFAKESIRSFVSSCGFRL